MGQNRAGDPTELWNGRIKPGMEVMAADGERLGSVKQARENDFVMDREAGFDIPVLYSQVRSIDENFVTLSVKASELDSSGMGNHPYDKHAEPDEVPRPGDIKL